MIEIHLAISIVKLLETPLKQLFTTPLNIIIS